MCRHLRLRTGGICNFVRMEIQSKVVIGENMLCYFGVKVSFDPTQQEFNTELDAMIVDLVPQVSVE